MNDLPLPSASVFDPDDVANLRRENDRLREALRNIADFSGFSQRLFLGTDDPKHLVNALRKIEYDARNFAT